MKGEVVAGGGLGGILCTGDGPGPSRIRVRVACQMVWSSELPLPNSRGQTPSWSVCQLEDILGPPSAQWPESCSAPRPQEFLAPWDPRVPGPKSQGCEQR